MIDTTIYSFDILNSVIHLYHIKKIFFTEEKKTSQFNSYDKVEGMFTCLLVLSILFR